MTGNGQGIVHKRLKNQPLKFLSESVHIVQFTPTMLVNERYRKCLRLEAGI